jgi:hypothetical protein
MTLRVPLGSDGLERAHAEKFVVSQGLELRFEHSHHSHRVAEGIEDFHIITRFAGALVVVFDRRRHVPAAEPRLRQVHRQSHSCVEREFHASLGIKVTNLVSPVTRILALIVRTHKVAVLAFAGDVPRETIIYIDGFTT